MQKDLAIGDFKTPFGMIQLVASEEGLVEILFPDQPKRPASGKPSAAAKAHLETARTALKEYFAGKRKDFGDVTLAAQGTDFQKRVWRQLAKIPFGRTRTYGEIARSLGNPNAMRAVGLANGRNPLPIIVPCHRVIGANGKLVGFAGGLPVKKFLLDHEGVTTPDLL